MDLKDLLQNIKTYENKEITLQGWIRGHRKQKEFGFIEFSDGTTVEHLQLVYDNSLKDFEEIQKLHLGCAITVKGKIVKSEGSGQEFDFKVLDLKLEGDCPDDYPFQPKVRPTREYLRDIAYLRPRTNLLSSL